MSLTELETPSENLYGFMYEASVRPETENGKLDNAGFRSPNSINPYVWEVP